MKESELKIDWKKHVCYSKQAKKVIRKRLAEQFDAGETEKRWEDVQLKYVEYLETLPYLGGKKNGHNGAGGTYDCITVLAYYEVMDRKPDIEEIYELNNAVFLPSFRALGKLFNINHPWQMKLLNRIFEMTAKRMRQRNNAVRPDTECTRNRLIRIPV